MDQNGQYLGAPVSELSFTDLIEYNLEFLNGKLLETFYHLGPVDSETLPLLGKLKSINSFRFFTMEGQPSLREGPTFISKTWEVRGKTQGNWWYKSEQKSYIVGFIENSIASRNLLDYLVKNDKVYISIARKDESYESTFQDVYYNVTRESIRKLESTDWSEWILHTNISNEHYFEDNNIKAFEDCLFIHIAVKNYGQDSVEDILLNYYNNLK